MTSSSPRKRRITRWNTLRATLSRWNLRLAGAAPLAIGLCLGAGTIEAQSSVWDRTAQSVTQTAREHQTADYQVEAAAPVDVWANVRSAWTPVDASGQTLRRTEYPAQTGTAPATPPQSAARVAQTASRGTPAATPAPADDWRPRRPVIVPLPESVIRSSLDAGVHAPVTASTLLQRASTQPMVPESAVGVARLGLGSRGQTMDAAFPLPATGFPETPYAQTEFVADETELLAAAVEERAYALFDPPAVVNGDAASDTRYAFEGRAGYAALQPVAGGDQPAAAPLVTPPMPADSDQREGVVALDGLDAVSGAPLPQRDPYQPVPLQQIRPYRSYTPEGVTLCPAPDARCPEVKELPDSLNTTDRYFAHMDFLWVPANVFYSPLYFEDPYLERYGHTHGPLLQPLASTSRFGLQLVGLPYQMALDPPHRRVYPLGFYRPGECAPKQVPNIPLNAEAAAKAGAVYTGLIFAFP